MVRLHITGQPVVAGGGDEGARSPSCAFAASLAAANLALASFFFAQYSDACAALLLETLDALCFQPTWWERSPSTQYLWPAPRRSTLSAIGHDSALHLVVGRGDALVRLEPLEGGGAARVLWGTMPRTVRQSMRAGGGVVEGAVGGLGRSSSDA